MMNAWKWGTSLVFALAIALCSGPAVAEIVGPETNCFDGSDNNFDGRTDCADPTCNGAIGPPTDCGVGPCAAEGELICQSGSVVDTCTPGVPTDEVCDDIDNDCDGSIDEDLPFEKSFCGVGECARTGGWDCVSGVPVSTCIPGDPQDEVCNDLDDDCNGNFDDIPSLPSTCGVGACENTGEVICQGGALNDTCTPLPPSSEGPFGDLACSDGIDNDCDTLADAVDPNCAPPAIETACFDQVDNDGDDSADCADSDCANVVDGPCDTGFAGPCAAGQDRCVSAALECVQLVFPQSEICSDGIDNDCDGFVDAADPGCVAIDFDFGTFRVAPKVNICPPPNDPAFRIAAVVKNVSNVQGMFDVTVVGVLKNSEIYRHVISVYLLGGEDARITFPEPSSVNLTGLITWTAAIVDGNADVDMRTARTKVVCVP